MRRRSKGFALLEVLISVVILSVGLFSVSRPLLNSLSITAIADQRMEVNRLLSNYLWGLKTEITKNSAAPSGVMRGILSGEKRNYPFTITIGPINENDQLFQMDIDVRWSGIGRKGHVERTLYLSMPHALDI